MAYQDAPFTRLWRVLQKGLAVYQVMWASQRLSLLRSICKTFNNGIIATWGETALPNIFIRLLSIRVGIPLEPRKALGTGISAVLPRIGMADLMFFCHFPDAIASRSWLAT